jgi:Uma2 family endonuclease
MAVANIEAHRWTRDEYERMAEAGFFPPEARVELIDGIVYDMTPQSSFHSVGILAVQEFLRGTFSPGHYIRVQMPLALDGASQPEPDLAVVTGSFADHAHAHPATAVLVAEVADRSLLHDRQRKLPLYARAGIPEFWLLLVKERALEVYRDPVDGEYQTRIVLRIGDLISPEARPDASLAVADLFPWEKPRR